MQDWTYGYVSEIPYTYSFFAELSPSLIGYAALCKGFVPPPIAQNFTYCELGCGRGGSVNLLAAANPQGEFFANDFNPKHIAIARNLAAEAETSNVHFFDRSFEEFINEDLPDFDFIVLQGIYSWISLENRQAIVQFLAKKLKVGGLVYLSYNCLPGWSYTMPLRELMLAHSEQSTEPLVQRIDRAIQFAEKLLETEAAYFNINPGAKADLERIKGEGRNYLAHEYFNRDWHPMYFKDVMQELTPAKLNYLGSADLIHHIDYLCLPVPAQELFKENLPELKNPIFQETVRDFAINRRFRRDIFEKGALSLSQLEQIERLEALRFTMIVPRSFIKKEMQVPAGKATLENQRFGPVLDILEREGTVSLQSLSQQPTLKNLDFAGLHQVLVILMAGGYLQLTLPTEGGGERKQRTDRFNAAVRHRSRYDNRLLAEVRQQATGNSGKN
jgi:SAM-dependent methyltransferase